MNIELVSKMIFGAVGGLGLFLLGMNYMREGLQTVAGSTFRRMIHLITANRVFGVGVGLVVTCIIQSSSITTVMVVGLINSELMNLSQAIGVIMGANIGTTITGWILAIHVGKYGLPILGLAALVWLFSKKEKVKFVALAFLGIGMIFFGLEMMKEGFKPIRSMPEFEAWFLAFDASTYFGVLKCAMVGCILTLIVQSSSATLGITIGLATTGVIPFETAAALVLGENIGTTITAYLASLGATVAAKRAAYFHIIFNSLGVFWITLVFPWYLPIIRTVVTGDPNQMVMDNGEETYPYITTAIAAVHTGFNVTNTLIFLPFSGFFAVLLNRVGKELPKKEARYLTRLDFRMGDPPFAAIEQSSHELIRMGEHVKSMYRNLKNATEDVKENKAVVEELFEREDILDDVQREITTFLTNLLSTSVSLEISREAHTQLRVADEYESISDDITAILKLYLRMADHNVALSSEQSDELSELHELILNYFEFVHDPIQVSKNQFMNNMYTKSDEINAHVRDLRRRHWKRLSNGKTEPLVSTSYMDIYNSYRRIKDHIVNVAEAVAGKKRLS